MKKKKPTRRQISHKIRLLSERHDHIENLMALAGTIEWAGNRSLPMFRKTCPACEGLKPEHKKKCWLGAVIRLHAVPLPDGSGKRPPGQARPRS